MGRSGYAEQRQGVTLGASAHCAIRLPINVRIVLKRIFDACQKQKGEQEQFGD